MEKLGKIFIRISGKKGNFDLSPQNFDIRELAELLQQVEHLLFATAKKDRSLTSYQVSEGSVIHTFSTTQQTAISFNAWLRKIENEDYSLNFLEPATARAFEALAANARNNDYYYQVYTSVSDNHAFIIDKNTKFKKNEDIWVDAEFYLYGTIVDAGGKNRANIHLDTKEWGVIKVSATIQQLESYELNPLYKSYGVRVLGKQHLKTGEMDKSSLQLLEMQGFRPIFEEDYIKSLIQKAKKNWSDVDDADQWLKTTRGYGT
ncbi:MAG: hypothetical protein RL757_1996 [Bacteroidota bacterium]